MTSHSAAARRFHPADAVFAALLLAYAAASVSLIPFDFTDLCYLFSLENGTWATQEWVHPIYVPTLRVLAAVLGAFGYHGRMLVPVELMNVGVACAAYVLLYALARRLVGASFVAVAALAVTATSTGFWSATMRSTPYALAMLCQVISLSLLISDRPVRVARYALAGAFAGLSMGYHASAMALGLVGVACALLEPDPMRSRRDTLARIAAFGGAMLAVAIAEWSIFLLYNGLGAEYFGRQDFQATFHGIEQVPGTSIYSSGSVGAQIASFASSVSYQARVLVWVAIVVGVIALVRRFRDRSPRGPAVRRLAIATAANCAAIAAFFLINNTHNGFIFAAFTLVPVWISAAIGRSWICLAVMVLLALPGTVDNVARMMRSGASGANDPQLAEVRFLARTIGPRDVLLTPGSPFPEMLYLSHLNVFEVSTAERTHRGSEVPVVHPGPALRARIGRWLANGGRVIYALGDDTTDFTGDVGGAEKEKQIFWRNELTAHERAPMLHELRAAVESSGIVLHDTLVSPKGNRYAEIALADPTPATTPAPDVAAKLLSHQLRDGLAARAKDGTDPQLPGRIRFLTALEATLSDDPWMACDWMTLTCDQELSRDGERVACRPLTGCDERIVAGLSASGDSSHHHDTGGRHITPAVGRMLQDAAPHALEVIARGGFSVSHVDVRGDTVELTIRDADQGEYAITLALPEAKHDGTPDGRGRNFLFYLAPAKPGANAAAASALLDAAARFDAAIPDTAWQSD